MSKYNIGIDIGSGKDESVYTVVRGPRWYEKVAIKLRLIRPFTMRVVAYGKVEDR